MAEALHPGDIAWLEAAKDAGHCGEGSMDLKIRNDHNDRIDRILAACRPPVADAGSVGRAEPVAWIVGNDQDNFVSRSRSEAETWGNRGARVTPLFAAPPALGGWKPDWDAVVDVADDLRAISNDMANAKVPESLWRPVYEQALALEAMLPIAPPIAAAPKGGEA